MLNAINHLFNLKKIVIIKALFDQSQMKIYGKKQIVYWALTIGIQSLFETI